jgi:DNA-binding beta-propeller fold protein YncE
LGSTLQLYWKVIDGNNNTNIKNITVGESPEAIAVDTESKFIYVVNSDGNTGGTVSVIDGENDTKIGKDIPVGMGPSAIEIIRGKIYVANEGDNTVCN